MTFKLKLSDQVSDFRKWQIDNYSRDQILNNTCDDPSYPNWQEVEDLFKETVLSHNFKTLDSEDLQNLLYLIARNWDIGSLLNSYSDNPFHSDGIDMEELDFLRLAKAACELNSQEYIDAKSQIAACFRKLTSLTTEAETILLTLYNQPDEYTKRQALLSLGKLGYNGILSLLDKSWQIPDEWHKIACLSVIEKYLKDEVLLYHYLNKIAVTDGCDLRAQKEWLMASNNR